MNKLYPFICFLIGIIIALSFYIYLTRFQSQKYFSICRDDICAFVERVRFENKPDKNCVYGFSDGDTKEFEGCGTYSVKTINKNDIP